MSKVGPFATGAEHTCTCIARACFQARQYTDCSTYLYSKNTAASKLSKVKPYFVSVSKIFKK